MCATFFAAASLCAAGLVALPGVASAATSGSVPLPGGAMIRAAAPGNSSIPTVSLNWSGYAATSGKKFTYVHSTFVQPAVTCSGIKNQWTSNWVGLDGFNNGTVEQTGTFAHCAGPQSTKPVYKAWYEMFPAGSVNVFTVHAGDVMDTAVKYAGGTFTLTVSDLTTGKTASHSATCATCQRSSAEWIIERPALCNNALTKCFIARLANFGTATMGGTQAQVAGGPVKGIGGFTNFPIDMVNPLKSGGFISLDTVSALSGKTFSATWDRTGTKVPISLGPAS
jgi:Peptidase A4 family